MGELPDSEVPAELTPEVVHIGLGRLGTCGGEVGTGPRGDGSVASGGRGSGEGKGWTAEAGAAAEGGVEQVETARAGDGVDA